MSTNMHKRGLQTMAISTLVVLIAGTWAFGQTTAPGENAATAPAEATATTSPAAGQPESSTPAEEPQVKAAQSGTFEIHFHDSGLREAFQLLSSQGHKNIIATKEVTGRVTADLYGVTFKEALEAVLKTTGFVYEEEGNFIYVMTPDQRKAQQEAARKIVVQTYHLAYVTAADARLLITPAMSKDGTAAVTPSAGVGIPSSKTDSGGNTFASEDVLVVRDYEENIRNVTDIIHKLDVKPEQVLIEATILRCTLEEDTSLGIDINSLAGIDFGTLGNTTINDTSIIPPTAGTPITPKTSMTGTVRTDFIPSITQTGGLTVGFIGDDISFFVKAVESVTDTTVLANPKLLVVNKQRGEIMVGNRDGYLTTTVAENVVTQSVQFLETGTRLIVRPYIGRNGNVRMELHPEDSSGSVSNVGGSVLPKETTTEVTSNVIVRDGHTLVIGGLFRERTIDGRSQVPILGNIPIIGAACRATDNQTKREEVIILLTPHIIQQAADEATGEQLKDDAERFRIGARQGLQWFCRSRLAQTHMRCAKQALAKGHIHCALAQIDLALSMDPHMIEAMRLKERLTDRAYWADEARISSAKYVIQQMMMQELGKPVAQIIPPGKPYNPSDIDPAIRRKFGIGEQFEEPLPMSVMGKLRSRAKHPVLPDQKGTAPQSATEPAQAELPEDAQTPQTPASDNGQGDDADQDSSMTPAPQADEGQSKEAKSDQAITTQPVVQTTDQPTTQPVADAVVTPTTQSVVDEAEPATTQPIAETTTQPAPEPVAHDDPSPATEPAADVTPEATTQSAANTTAQPTTQPLGDATNQQGSRNDPQAVASNDPQGLPTTQPVSSAK